MFVGVWFCESCGNEVCSACYAELKRVTGDNNTQFKRAADRYSSRLDRLLQCQRNLYHSHLAFHPIGAFSLSQIFDILQQLQLYTVRDLGHRAQFCDSLEIHKTTHSYTTTSPFPTSSFPLSRIQLGLTDLNAQIPSLSLLSIPADQTQVPFDNIWRARCPLVVTSVLGGEDMSIWTPEALTARYGAQTCHVFDCESKQIRHETTVGQFLSRFGQPDAEDSLAVKVCQSFWLYCSLLNMLTGLATGTRLCYCFAHTP